MIIRSILAPSFFIGLIAWFMWILLPLDACTRIERAGSPLRVGANVIAFVAGPWIEKDTKAGMKDWGESADLWFQGLVSKQFFDSISCRSSNTVVDETAEDTTILDSVHVTAAPIDEDQEEAEEEIKKSETVELADPLTGEVVTFGEGE